MDQDGAMGKKPGKFRAMLTEYGPLGIGVYLGMWAVGIPPLYAALAATNNFGMDPSAILDYVGTDTLFGYDLRALTSKPKYVSIALALVLNEVAEPLRWLLVIPVTRVVRRMLDARKGRRQV